MSALASEHDPALPYLVVNTGGHPIARFAVEEHANEYSAQWLGLLSPIDSSIAGNTGEAAVAEWTAKQKRDSAKARASGW
ncbi:hypothetical protein [Arthrobacter sp. efr-133-TYG-118]|uniref:hypothetical protein n=1 Tax=Arthrobacter sp. efr-133-TYG-118 TaxID=3040279 RepID=UPI00254E87CF|nr:hypothetical protein [Arthrobacter sp. efr-133-TYG-118]